MKLIFRKQFTWIFVLALAALMIIPFSALAFDSGGKPSAIGPNHIEWTGQGASNGVLDSKECPSLDEVPDGINPNSYLHWIFTTDGGSAENAVLHLSGSGSGDYSGTASGGAFHFFTPYYTPDSNLIASAIFDVLTTGNGGWVLTISHGCPGSPSFTPLTATKTANGGYDRTVTWDLQKTVDDDNHSGQAGQDAGSSKWTVTATKNESLGNYKVTGEITVNNSNSIPVDFSISDVLNDASPTAASVSCPSYTVPAASGGMDGSITCSYTASPSDGSATQNTATVTSNTPGVAGAMAKADVSFKENLIGDESVMLGDERFDYSKSINTTTSVDFPETFACSSDPNDYTNGAYSYTATNVATLKGDSTDLNDDAKVTVNCTLPKLTAEKTAAGSYDHTITWDLAKSVTPDTLSGSFGQTNIGSATWTVKATKSAVDSNYKVTGNITVYNPAAIPQTFTVSDVLDDSTLATVSCPTYILAAGDKTTCTYTAATATATSNTATVSAAGNADVTTNADVAYTANVIGDESVTLADPRFNYSETINNTTTKTFPEAFACSSNVADYGTNDSITTSYPNKATLKGDNNDLEASAEVKTTCTAMWKSETATVQGLPWSKLKGAPSTWFMYTTWDAINGKTVPLIAGQFYQAGTVSAMRDGTSTKITITLNPGYRFANVLSNLKIQPFNSAPTSYIQPGSFQYKFNVPTGQTVYTATIPGVTATYYGIHADVQRIVTP